MHAFEEAGITSEPNGPLFAKLFAKVGVRATIYKSKGYDCVPISVSDAAKVRILNPELETHRNLLLNKLAAAQTFQARWPQWLNERVRQLLTKNPDVRAVRNTLLFEDNTYVKLRTLKVKISRMMD